MSAYIHPNSQHSKRNANSDGRNPVRGDDRGEQDKLENLPRSLYAVTSYFRSLILGAGVWK
jgi:hypothetical protein